MNLHARPYRDATDFAAMRQLVMTGTQANISASYMHPGLLDYHTHYPDMRYPPAEQANRRNLRLWENMEEEPPTLAAWAIFSRLEGSFDLFVQPALHGTPLIPRQLRCAARATADTAGAEALAQQEGEER